MKFIVYLTTMLVKLDKAPVFTYSVIKTFSGLVNIAGLDRVADLGLWDGRFTGKHQVPLWCGMPRFSFLCVYVLSLWKQEGRCCCHIQCMLPL